MKHTDWKQAIRQPRSLPGQQFLFGDTPIAASPRNDCPTNACPTAEISTKVAQPNRTMFVNAQGQRYLLDVGHGLPGVNDSRQFLLWDA